MTASVRDASLREAMRSRLFRELREGGHLDDDHVGGCVLFEKRKEVERILEEGAKGAGNFPERVEIRAADVRK